MLTLYETLAIDVWGIAHLTKVYSSTVGWNGTEIRVYKSLKTLIFRRVGIAHMAYFSAIHGRVGIAYATSFHLSQKLPTNAIDNVGEIRN